jgi:hypothetical protein
MKKSSIIFVCLCLMALFVYTGSAQAEFSYLSDWANSPNNAGSTSNNAGCQLCHISAGGGNNFNPYGDDIRLSSAGNIGARIADVEGLDSDGDPGFFPIWRRSGPTPSPAGQLATPARQLVL